MIFVGRGFSHAENRAGCVRLQRPQHDFAALKPVAKSLPRLSLLRRMTDKILRNPR
jgi:hypothetical protein